MYRRCSGILMHITSLPNRNAYEFIDFLERANQKLWQILPIGPVGVGNSPYQSSSAFAGNPDFIDRKKFEGDEESFQNFKKENSYWLRDYALFRILKKRFCFKKWNEWPIEYKFRNEEALRKIEAEQYLEIEMIEKEQFCFYIQWKKIKEYANKKKIKIVGDIPIFVSTDSADTWSHRELFQFDIDAYPINVSGVPPDIFSTEGQLWGNVLYDWKELKSQKYEWWIKRFQQSFERYDILRVDHFRGFESFWSIKSGSKTAKEGKWVKGPGIDFFKEIEKVLGPLSIIAEDLGFVTSEVRKLVQDTGYPGMKILEFAFDPRGESEYLPHRCSENSVIYTGTHDNMTVIEWYETIDKNTKKFCDKYLENYLKRYDMDINEAINWKMIEAAFLSNCIMAIIPMQDFLGLGHEGRMNTPSLPYGNWNWKCCKANLTEMLAEKIKKMTKKYNR